MDKPRIFLGSSGKQQKLLQAIMRGLEDVAQVVPWTTSFNPGVTTLERLLELTREVDFAAFLFARDDWTANTPPVADASATGQASPRDNVVFEAGLFGGVLGMRRTFILHANGAKLPSDLLGLTCVRYGDATTAAEMKVVNQKLRNAIENEWGTSRIEGAWWQLSLTERTALEPSAVIGDRHQPDIPVGQDFGRVEPVACAVDLAHRRHAAMERPHRSTVMRMACRRALRRGYRLREQ